LGFGHAGGGLIDGFDGMTASGQKHGIAAFAFSQTKDGSGRNAMSLGRKKVIGFFAVKNTPARRNVDSKKTDPSG